MEGDLVRQINEALTKSGERERLKELVKERLRQAGWFDQLVAEVDSSYQIKELESFSNINACCLRRGTE